MNQNTTRSIGLNNTTIDFTKSLTIPDFDDSLVSIQSTILNHVGQLKKSIINEANNTILEERELYENEISTKNDFIGQLKQTVNDLSNELEDSVVTNDRLCRMLNRSLSKRYNNNLTKSIFLKWFNHSKKLLDGRKECLKRSTNKNRETTKKLFNLWKRKHHKLKETKKEKEMQIFISESVETVTSDKTDIIENLSKELEATKQLLEAERLNNAKISENIRTILFNGMNQLGAEVINLYSTKTVIDSNVDLEAEKSPIFNFDNVDQCSNNHKIVIPKLEDRTEIEIVEAPTETKTVTKTIKKSNKSVVQKDISMGKYRFTVETPL
eukprot:TRINITY_DN9214_c0_g1_i1.p1 TRINITY_DN9214_c0_g1~~TRINITY_DN9214_c0_g1_i1.p1  ORF type:complete len:325 (+),score=98.47 TRINITY_DN9214_c0_g1_i1:53-1027(+)